MQPNDSYLWASSLALVKNLLNVVKCGLKCIKYLMDENTHWFSLKTRALAWPWIEKDTYEICECWKDGQLECTLSMQCNCLACVYESMRAQIGPWHSGINPRLSSQTSPQPAHSVFYGRCFPTSPTDEPFLILFKKGCLRVWIVAPLSVNKLVWW